MSFNTNKYMSRMFRRIDGIVWDALTGQVGLKTTDGVFTYAPGEAGDTGQVTVNILDMSIALPGFAMATPFDDVQIGDVVVGDSKIIGWVDEKLVNSFRVKDHHGFTKVYTPPKVSIGGVEGALVVKNLFAAAGGAQNINSMLPMLMMAGGDDKIEKILPFMLMQQGGASAGAAGAGGMNPMLMAMLMKDGGLGKKSGGGIDPMMLMMMGGMGGGAGGMNPMVMAMMMGGLGDSSEPTPVSAPRGLPPLNSIRQG